MTCLRSHRKCECQGITQGANASLLEFELQRADTALLPAAHSTAPYTALG